MESNEGGEVEVDVDALHPLAKTPARAHEQLAPQSAH